MFSSRTSMTGDSGKVGSLFIYLTDKSKQNVQSWKIFLRQMKKMLQFIHHILGGREPCCHAYIQRDVNY